MATAMVRCSLRTALRCGARVNQAPKRTFSSAAHDDAYETAKWEKITYAGIAACTILAFINLSKGHPHFEEPPAYPYLHIRNKEFPWAILWNITLNELAFLFYYHPEGLTADVDVKVQMVFLRLKNTET